MITYDRNFLSHFRIPGEAQKIDRIMERFAEKYFRDHPEGFADLGTFYSFHLLIE